MSKERLIIIGGDAAGMSAASQAKLNGWTSLQLPGDHDRLKASVSVEQK